MTTIQAMLAYFRLAAYSIVMLSSIFATLYGVKNVKKVFIGNICFALFSSLSVIHYVALGKNLEMVVSIFITIGASLWAIFNFNNFIRHSK